MDLEQGESVDLDFLIRDVELRRTANGSTYLACLLRDRSGAIQGRWWQANREQVETLPKQGFVRISGRTTSHRGQLQIAIDDARPLDSSEVEHADFLPSSDYDVEQMWEELLKHLTAISNPHLRRLMDKVVADERLVRNFKRAPAAASMHHAYLGGLLQHTLSVVRLAKSVAALYEEKLDVDLLVVGAFLHDIGKTEELSSDISIEYTQRGNLVGHIVSAAIWVQQKADELERETGRALPATIVDIVQHLVLSNHGTLEYGSPKRPMIPEAIVLHHVDNLDAKVEMSTRAISEDGDDRSAFTPYQRSLEARLYKRAGNLPK